jgi:hypothetical protein
MSVLEKLGKRSRPARWEKGQEGMGSGKLERKHFKGGINGKFPMSD